MIAITPLKTVFFGFTGLGSAVLKELIVNGNASVDLVYTKHYENPYPYYNEQQVTEICKESEIECRVDKKINAEEEIARITEVNPDLILVASFNQIISEKVRSIPKLGAINFHPSLLPKYRGPYPDQAVLLNGESETGVSLHYITGKVDGGNILIQKKIKIDENDNYSSLKKKLAEEAGKIVRDAVELFLHGNAPQGTAQNENEATSFQKVHQSEGFLEREPDILKIKNKIRALNPFPGTSFLINGARVSVDAFEMIEYKGVDSISAGNNEIFIHSNPHGIRLFKKD